MEQITISLPYAKIRAICEAQIKFTEQECPWSKPVTLRTSFNNELELLDLEWDAYMWPWAERFDIPIYDQFDYYAYFWEVEFTLLSDIVWWIKAKWKGEAFKSFSERLAKPDLTVGDFAASVILGRFIKRENLYVRISNA